ncbi:MAG: ParB/RepB/Spo0J family partition protein [Candidatus Hatepunaea meridiana]|nr:ParB/RepB/Spo0J family partition protein [Candidatus Hatepunaea meridiana]
MKSRGLGRGLSALLPDADKEHLTGLLEIRLSEIKPNPYQPRREFDPGELEDLTASIKAKGIIQPLAVMRKGSKFLLIAGERRLRAAAKAGLKTVPARLIEVDGDADMLELSLIENLQRQDLNPVELAEGYRNLKQKWGLTQEIIARRVGKDRATVANTLRMLDLPDQILNSLRKGEITVGHAKVILSLNGPARQSALWKKIMAEKLSVRQSEEIARLSSSDKKSGKQSKTVKQPVFQEYIDRVRRALGTQIHIGKRGKKGFIRIEFYSDEDLIRLIELLEGKRE